MNRRAFLPFLISAVLVLLHVWSDSVLAHGLSTAARTAVYVADAIGFILSLTAIFLDLPKINRAYAALDWIGYTSLGVFAWMLTSAIAVEVVRGAHLVLPSLVPDPPGGAGLFLVAILTAWSLYEGIRFPRVTRYRRRFAGRGRGTVAARAPGGPRPAGDSAFRIVQLSDLHIGMLHLRRKRLERIVAAVNAQSPDVVVITGDLIESEIEGVRDDLEPLRDVRAPGGRFYVTGNHEYYYGGAVWERLLKGYGWTILHSSSALVPHGERSVQISGVPDLTVRYADPKGAIDYDRGIAASNADLKVFLVHQPGEIRFLKKELPDLVLTGHTHGGQLFPFRPFVRLMNPVVAGWKRIEGMDLFVHRGTGFWGPPMRLGAPSEIAVIDVEFASAAAVASVAKN